ncbi:unnamed protein product [Polarella glacialis]|uniref:Uncharacterized protein n=1 Tax=Polarella glacialis TaxID=89957 RepID=A0A813JUY0_POLGL|nr:unnamed protein product [Polarella glacialis]CAE8684084.1 unnamed protein product [Polarella glacialis]
MSNAVGETCAAGNCFWVVDAFRLTRVGDVCTSEPEQQLKGSVFLQPGLQAGSLRLTVEMNPSSTAGLLADLKAQTGVFEATLKTQLGAVSVRVGNIEAMAVEGFDRRLQATSAPFKVSFKAEVPSSGLWARKVLVSELSLALAAAGATLKVRSAELTWPQTTVDGAGSVNFDVITILIVVGGVSFVAPIILVGIYWMCKSRKSVEPTTDVEAGSKQGEVKPEEPESLDKENKEKENAYIDDNDSTVSPASEQSVDTA